MWSCRQSWIGSSTRQQTISGLQKFSYNSVLDPDSITLDAIFNRLLEIFLANITIANICALLGATFFVTTLLRWYRSAFRT